MNVSMPVSVRIFFILLIIYFIGGCSTTGLRLSVANSAAKLGDYSVVSSLSYGRLESQNLDIYRPVALSSPLQNQSELRLPVIVFFYGGCWGNCSAYRKADYAFVAEAFTEQGYIVVIPDYRFYPSVLFPEIIDDARQAVEWVWRNIEVYGGNSGSIFLMGHSAGAHLAALLTLDERRLNPDTYKGLKGFIGLAGPYDFLPFTKEYQKDLFGPEGNYANSQPVNFVNGTEPPLLLLYGNDDKTVKARNIDSLSNKVDQHGGRVITHRYDGIGHAEILGALSRLVRNDFSIAEDILIFLKEQL